jgi:FkbM family methyltransferase
MAGSSSPPRRRRWLARLLRAGVRGISPRLEAAAMARYWNLRQRALVWLITSYHRYRGSILVVDGVKLQVNRSVSRFMVEVIWSGHHTLPERTLVLEALTGDDVVLELGGGIGLLAISCAKRIGAARVFSFEANRTLEPLVRRNCELNGVQPTFEFCALGNSDGATTLHVGRDFWESSVIRTRQHDRTLSVPVRAFDREVARIQPTFLIVDIEGAEEELFRHANLAAFDKIMIELHPAELGADRADAVKRRIREAGFEQGRQLDARWFLYRRTRAQAVASGPLAR